MPLGASDTELLRLACLLSHIVQQSEKSSGLRIEEDTNQTFFLPFCRNIALSSFFLSIGLGSIVTCFRVLLVLSPHALPLYLSSVR